MSPAIERAVHDEAENQAAADHKAYCGKHRIERSEDLEPQACGPCPEHGSKDEHRPRNDMHDVVRGVHHEEPEIHPGLRNDARNESDHSADQEKAPHNHSEFSDHYELSTHFR